MYSKAHLEDQLKKYYQNLEILEQREADHGGSMHSPLPLRKEIENTKATIVDLQAQLEVVRQPRPFTRVVDPLNRGDHVTITAAVRAARPGDRILIRPGIYKERLDIKKPLELIGDGPRDDIIIQATGRSVIDFKTTQGRIANLTLRQMGGKSLFRKDGWHCIEVIEGYLELEDCDLSGQSFACIGIRFDARAKLRRNRIHSSPHGVAIYERGNAELEENEIFGHELSGVGLSDSGSLKLCQNRIHHNSFGVNILDGVQTILEDNHIFDNTKMGVSISKGGKADLYRNHIYNNTETGIFIGHNSACILEDNVISGHEHGVFSGGNSSLCRNYIHLNKIGVNLAKGSQDILENNNISDNFYGVLLIVDNSGATLRDNRINKNEGGICIVGHSPSQEMRGHKGGVIIEDNDLRDNNLTWLIPPIFEPYVTRARNLE